MKTVEAFNLWLTCIPDNCTALMYDLPPEIATALDGTLASVDVLEAHLMARYTPEELTSEANEQLLSRLASYVGQVAEREMNGSYWSIQLDDEKDVDHGFPVLRFKDDRASFNPFTYVTTAMDRKRGNLISGAIVRRKG